VIDDERQLGEFLSCLRTADWIALDTEADSLHAYPEKLCLLQLSGAGVDELVDPLAPIDLAPLLELLGKHELILHGADYDLRLLRRTFGFVPSAIFDTMLAARLLGHLQFGLTSLVAQLLAVTLEKGPQKANWAVRPLTERMENYARNDSRYLRPLSEALRGQLREKGRLEWHRETCAQLIRDCAEPRTIDPDEVWRLKGSDKLMPRAQAILRELWRWREREAVAANKPPYFILSHEAMVAFSREAAELGAPPEIAPRQVAPRRQAGFLAALAAGLAVPAADWPQRRRVFVDPLTAGEKQRFEDLRRIRDRRAGELGIDPTLIASRATMVALAKDTAAAQIELLNWQRDLLFH